ncbi:MAG: hypothetical protein GVY36_18830 [Verrucomicrobia bacterium]|nr:hypothetical protein [Verrucomicrobiota bacterium]
MKIITVIAALILATNVSANSCRESLANSQGLLDDLKSYVEDAREDFEDATEAEARRINSGLMRRARSLKSSLISIRVYCDSSEHIKWANELADLADIVIVGVQ